MSQSIKELLRRFRPPGGTLDAGGEASVNLREAGLNARKPGALPVPSNRADLGEAVSPGLQNPGYPSDFDLLKRIAGLPPFHKLENRRNPMRRQK